MGLFTEERRERFWECDLVANREQLATMAEQSRARMRAEGIQTNVPLHQAILDDPGFRQGGYNIHHLEHWITARAAQQ